MRWKTVMRPKKAALGIALSLLAALAFGQSNLGQVLDAGGKKLSVEDFKEQLVQRMLVGPSPTGVPLEMIYTTQGSVVGSGASPSGILMTRFGGQWRSDAEGKVCASMTVAGVPGGGTPGSVILPERCQSWYKLGDQYFVSDSDIDRSARVLLRRVKQ
jgi:hypothetical protein